MSDDYFQRGRSSELRKGRVSEAYACYTITKVVNHRRAVLARPAVATVLIESWSYLRRSAQIRLFAFCVMPDHYHLAFSLMPGADLSAALESTNKFTARRINLLIGAAGQFWQEGFRDRRHRGREELHDSCVYIEHNPVRAGLAKQAHEWPHSSAHPSHRGMLDRAWWP